MAITLNNQISAAFNTNNIIHNWIWGFIDSYNATYNDLCMNTLFIIKQISNKLRWSWYNLHRWLITYAILESENRPDYDNYQYQNLRIMNNFVRFLIRQKYVAQDTIIYDSVSLQNINYWMETFKNHSNFGTNTVNRMVYIPSINTRGNTRGNTTVINLVIPSSTIEFEESEEENYDSMPELEEGY